MEWLVPWSAAERPNLVAAYEHEARAEIGRGHPLYGQSLAALGKRGGSDDVLFQILDGSGRVVGVHLTWAKQPKPSPWPGCELFTSLGEWAELRMRPDHDEFTADDGE